ncbi:MAG TPA: sigma-54 dependent transcriptional regulator [Gemmataceae bacterium]|nr:sigma-54 dependent transcriptional regulator [Gemmataceae bacterium]
MRKSAPLAPPSPTGRPDDSARALLDAVRDLGPLLADPSDSSPAPAIVGRSPPLLCVLEQARRVAASKAAVLIQGESGTGKELVARLIHARSPRRAGPFVRVNCAALAESLVESELFGHERGAFTGAEGCRLGRFELAHGGTLLLDEVGEIAVRLQAKLLRALEEEEFERVGGVCTLRSDVRVVATTNRDLEREIGRGGFRADLYYRLNGVQLWLPPLRDRREDIPALAAHFFERFRHEAAAPLAGVSEEALAELAARDWPGNVRQLRNAVHRACLLAAGPLVRPEDLPPREAATPPAESYRGLTLEEVERRLILATLRELGGNKTAAAERLGVTPRTLLNKLNRYRAEGAA